MRLFNRRKQVQERLQKEQVMGSSLISLSSPQSVVAEQFRSLRTNIEFAQVDEDLKSLLVSSSISAEGKSTISANLAIVFAQTEKKVLIVDADMRKPTLHRTFRLNNQQGLSTLISDSNLSFNQAIQWSPEINLYFLPSGPIPPNPSEMLGSARMKYLMQEFEGHFDLVIYDTPPVTAVTDAQVLASLVDGVVLVCRHGYVRREEVRRAKKVLDNVDANILGYVMNSRPSEAGDGYYSYYGYGYGAEGQPPEAQA